MNLKERLQLRSLVNLIISVIERLVNIIIKISPRLDKPLVPKPRPKPIKKVIDSINNIIPWRK